MTPSAAINHVLDSVDGIEIDADNDETVTTLLAAATAIAGIALMRVGDAGERGALLLGIERGVSRYISKVTALQAKRHGANGSSRGHTGCHPLGFAGEA
jgi:hypothetical protein